MPIDGEAITQRVYLIKNNPIPTDITLDLPESQLSDCCGAFSFKVLADVADSDPYKNDRSSFLWWFDQTIITAVIKLYKWSSQAGYTQTTVLNNNNHGIFYDYDFFINDAGDRFVGYNVDWREVLDEYGQGTYKVAVLASSIFGSEFTLYSDAYCLKPYSAGLANGTMRIEYYLNGLMGINEADEKIRDYGTINWYNSIRVPGHFGFPKSSYSKEYTIYNNGSRQWVKDEQEQEFSMQIKRIWNSLHNILRTDVMQADLILVTDYNSNNPETFIQKSIQLTGEYAPTWHIMQSKLASVDLKFRLGTNNLRKNRQ